MSYDSYRYMEGSSNISGTRWADAEELRQRLTRIDLTAEHYPTSGLPLLCDGKTAYVSSDDSHGLIMGSTGSKKSRLIAMPLMELFARAGESVICTDPKGELFERTSGLYEREGYDIKVLNLREPRLSHGWNPLHEALNMMLENKRDEAVGIVRDLSAAFFPLHNIRIDPFWAQTSRTLFEALCEMVLNKHGAYPEVSLRTVQQLSEGLTNDDIINTKSLIENYAPSSIERINLNSALSGSDKTTDNIIVSYKAGVQFVYSQESLMEMLSVNDIDFSLIGAQKTALYIIMPDEKTTLHPLVSLFIKQCYERLIYTAQSYEGKALPIRVNFLLDEFSNLPPIPDMSSMISAARSRNIRFYLVLQSLNQLKRKYGEDADTIRGNCNDWVFLHSREVELLNEMQTLCGTIDDSGRPLISISQLQRLDKSTGEALVMSGRLYPYMANLCDIDDYPYSHIPAAPLPKLQANKFEALDMRRAEYNLVIEKLLNEALPLHSEKDFSVVYKKVEAAGDKPITVKMGHTDSHDMVWLARKDGTSALKLYSCFEFHISKELYFSLYYQNLEFERLFENCRLGFSDDELSMIADCPIDIKGIDNHSRLLLPDEDDFYYMKGLSRKYLKVENTLSINRQEAYLLSNGMAVDGSYLTKECTHRTCLRPCMIVSIGAKCDKTFPVSLEVDDAIQAITKRNKKSDSDSEAFEKALQEFFPDDEDELYQIELDKTFDMLFGDDDDDV